MMVQQSAQGWARTHNLRITLVVALVQYQRLRPLSHLICVVRMSPANLLTNPDGTNQLLWEMRAAHFSGLG